MRIDDVKDFEEELYDKMTEENYLSYKDNKDNFDKYFQMCNEAIRQSEKEEDLEWLHDSLIRWQSHLSAVDGEAPPVEIPEPERWKATLQEISTPREDPSSWFIHDSDPPSYPFGGFMDCQCGVRNYLDHYTCWNYEGNVACAGCATVHYIKNEEGLMTAGPEQAHKVMDTRHPIFAANKLPGMKYTLEGTPEGGTEYLWTPEESIRPSWTWIPEEKTESYWDYYSNITNKIQYWQQIGKPIDTEEIVGSIWAKFYRTMGGPY